MRQAGTYSGIISGKTGSHSFPLARIKKIMKKSSGSSCDDVKMISGEAPIILSKACEKFVEEITKRAWNITIQGKRRTLHKQDVSSAVIATDVFDFLVNLVVSSSDEQIQSSGCGNSQENTPSITKEEELPR